MPGKSSEYAEKHERNKIKILLHSAKVYAIIWLSGFINKLESHSWSAEDSILAIAYGRSHSSVTAVIPKFFIPVGLYKANLFQDTLASFILMQGISKHSSKLQL